MNKKRVILLAAGPAILALCILLLPMPYECAAAIGTVVWMAFWWVTGPVDYAVTAFLPIAVNAFLQITDMQAIIQNYASETIMLLLGASILSVSWEETGLDKRIAAGLLSLVGENLRKQLVFWFLLSAALSSILPNSIVVATITPIAIAMLRYVGEMDKPGSDVAPRMLLCIAYAAGIGGLASPLGGAMNLLTVEYIQDLTGKEYMYTSWVIRFLPLMIVLLVSNILFMIHGIDRKASLGGSKEYFRDEYRKIPPMEKEEKFSLILFTVATVLSFTRTFYKDYLPGLKPAYVFIICALLSFLIVRKGGARLMLWNRVQERIVWDLIFIFAGGFAAGTLINNSGAANLIGDSVARMGLTGGFPTVFVIILFTVVLSDVTSSTATAAVTIPIVISVIQGVGLDPIPYIYIASIGFNISYTLPTSIRSIPVAYGVAPRYMFQKGWKLTIIVVVLMSAMSYCMLKYWPLFSQV